MQLIWEVTDKSIYFISSFSIISLKNWNLRQRRCLYMHVVLCVCVLAAHPRGTNGRPVICVWSGPSLSARMMNIDYILAIVIFVSKGNDIFMIYSHLSFVSCGV